jgi:hypothetical protein
VGNAYAVNQEVNTANVNVATNGVLNISSVQDSKKNDYFFVKLHSDPNYFLFMLKNGRVFLFV